jgi:hypothetical protein
VDNHDYDLFEIFPDGSPLWLLVVFGYENARRKLREWSVQTKNSIQLIDLKTRAIVVTENKPRP